MSRTKAIKELKMSLAEKMEMLRMSVRAITREYKVARLITGCLEENEKLDLIVDEELYNAIKKIQNN